MGHVDMATAVTHLTRLYFPLPAPVPPAPLDCVCTLGAHGHQVAFVRLVLHHTVYCRVLSCVYSLVTHQCHALSHTNAMPCHTPMPCLVSGHVRC